MVYFKYFNVKVPLEDFHLRGPLIFCGYSYDAAEKIYKKIINSLKKENIDAISFKDLIKYSAKFIEDSIIKKRFIIYNQYLISCYNGKIKNPFFIFIGGTSTSGKDTLSSDLQSLLGIDRMALSDSLRENTRNQFLKKYKKFNDVPEKYKPLFLPTVQIDDNGFNLQVEFFKKEVKETFIKQAEREYKKWVHPFFILQGTHIIPGVEEEVKGKNKIIVIINPCENSLSNRILSRWEREMGPMNASNKKERIEKCKRAIHIKNYVESLAIKKKSVIINSNFRQEVLHLFGEYLIDKLEEILKEYN